MKTMSTESRMFGLTGLGFHRKLTTFYTIHRISDNGYPDNNLA